MTKNPKSPNHHHHNNNYSDTKTTTNTTTTTTIGSHPRPITPNNQKYFDLSLNSPPISLFISRPPSPIPRDDIIEGMSLSPSSIFERDVQHFEASLTAQEAIQFAVPPVLDEAIQALATVPPEQILVDQVPLRVHFFNPTSSTVTFDSTPSSPLNRSSPSFQPSIPTYSNQFGVSPISSSSSPVHQRTKSIQSYPFPTSSELSPPISINPSAYPSRPSPPIPRSYRQAMSCTSDTASISDPSSPRSLTPEPSFMVGRSMFTQLADQEPATNTIYNHNISPLSELSSSPLKTSPGPILSTPTQPVVDNTHSLRQRKTCISFMSYVDILNSERSTDSPAPLSSALNALRMARKSTSSLVKRASSIFSQPPPRRGTSMNTNHIHDLGNESIGAAWTDRSRCTSTNSNYHSCPTHQPTIGENDQISPLSSPSNDEAEVLSDIDWN